jgi:hypothetical protein
MVFLVLVFYFIYFCSKASLEKELKKKIKRKKEEHPLCAAQSSPEAQLPSFLPRPTSFSA